jgi:hypothetical protein
MRAGRDDQGIGRVLGMAVAGQHEGAPLEIGRDDVIADHFGANMLGLEFHLLHEPGPLNHIGKAGIILHVGGGGHLAAGVETFNEEGLQHGARGIDGRGVAGGP